MNSSAPAASAAHSKSARRLPRRKQPRDPPQGLGIFATDPLPGKTNDTVLLVVVGEVDTHTIGKPRTRQAKSGNGVLSP